MDAKKGEAIIMRPERSFHYLVLSISAVFLFVLASFSAASAATVTVQSIGDGSAQPANCPGASCRLRDAIIAANPGDTIDFSVTGTITLTSDVLNLSRNLTIKGPGATNLTVSGNNVYEVFYVGGVTVNISGITISDGYYSDGSGIRNNGTLTLTNVTLSGNSADNYGGGIRNYGNGTLTLTNVTLSGNSASSGGGIRNDGTLTLTNVTLSGNSAEVGGGIANNGTSTLTNVTLSGNSAEVGGGIWEGYGTGISASLRNTIVASNTGGNCGGPGTITSLGHNLESGTDCGFTQTGDQQSADPELGPLALNAPGTTETFALESGSPAIDAGDNADLPPTDQRGAVRIWDGDGNGTAIVDIGAYEYGAPLYVPPKVPAMNEWGMIIFVLLAGLGSVYYLRRRAES